MVVSLSLLFATLKFLKWCRRGDSNPLFFSPVFTGFYALFLKPCVFPKKMIDFVFCTSCTTYTTRTYLRLS